MVPAWALMCKKTTWLFRCLLVPKALTLTILLVLCFPFANSLGVSGEEKRAGELREPSVRGKKQLTGVPGRRFPPEVTPAGCNLCVFIFPALQPCQGWLQLLRMWGENCPCRAPGEKTAKQPPVHG